MLAMFKELLQAIDGREPEDMGGLEVHALRHWHVSHTGSAMAEVAKKDFGRLSTMGATTSWPIGRGSEDESVGC